MTEGNESDQLPPVEWETPDCPLCGSGRWKLRLRAGDLLHQTRGCFQLVECRDCRHVYVSPRPTRESIGRFYPQDYAPHTPRGCRGGAASTPPDGGAASSPAWYLSRPIRLVPGLRRLYHWLRESHGEMMPPLDAPGRRALELGCAGGRFLELLREAGWQAEGVEPASAPAAEARQHGFRVHHGAFEPGLFANNSFDAVFAWMVLEHLHDPLGTLDEIQRILKPDGWFIFSVPNWACWEPAVFERYWYCLQPPIHLHQFTPRGLRRILAQTGYRDVRVIHQHNVFNLLGSLGLWLRTAFPQRRLGPRLLEFLVNPSVGGQLALAPLAKPLAWLHQGGRLTVTARVEKAKA
ncbi:MAG: class I SAM-dependent methyltransferase [Pirellulaceae bacterium]|jgi:SAM-dependent methyltransferase|nr:class I SAM-dependent methyltransferase [Thermoguttaceae bacterium]NLZ00519.1 class I SAM-dependent methyltransferase [Pirellulaceae bacterium]